MSKIEDYTDIQSPQDGKYYKIRDIMPKIEDYKDTQSTKEEAKTSCSVGLREKVHQL